MLLGQSSSHFVAGETKKISRGETKPGLVHMHVRRDVAGAAHLQKIFKVSEGTSKGI
jgi:hypothetical protein